jgi:hypothetical protein
LLGGGNENFKVTGAVILLHVHHYPNTVKMLHSCIASDSYQSVIPKINVSINT